MGIFSIIMIIFSLFPTGLGIGGIIYFWRAFKREEGFYAFLSAIFMLIFLGIFGTGVLGVSVFIGILLNS